MKYANPRTVWKNYIYKVIREAKRNKKDLTIFVHYHQNNSIPSDFKINETAAKIDFNFEFDTITIDETTTGCTGKVNDLIYVFNFADIIQLSMLEDMERTIDPKLIERSKKHLKFK